MRLVLWDLEGTLVNTAGHGRAAFADALEAVLGRPPHLDDVPMAGRTDHAIALDLLPRPPNRAEDARRDTLRRLLQDRRALLDVRPQALPDAHFKDINWDELRAVVAERKHQRTLAAR